MFDFIRRSIKRNFGIDKEYYRFIDDMFGFVPNNIELYKVALIHKSASQSIGGHHINNERLEYLGDAVIESITSDYLFIAYPDNDEGFLTQMRSKIVSRQSLNEMAVFIGLDKYLICKPGATLQQKHIYGDAFEAMMGAIYLDKGYEFTNRLLINDIYERFLSIDRLSEEENDFKSRLIEWCQKNRHSVEFRTRKEFDRSTSTQLFYTTVLIDGIEMGHGTGDSKKSAEQKASCSVSHEMSDEECAKLLDKIDRMMGLSPKKETASPSAAQSADTESKSSKRRNSRKKKSASPETGAAAATTTTEQEVKETEKQVKKAPDKEIEKEPEVSAPAIAAEEPVVAEEQPVKKRRSRKPKSEPKADETKSEPSAAPEAVEAEQSAAETPQEQPAKRRRRSRKSTADSQSEAAPEQSTDTAAEAAAQSDSSEAEPKQPAKRRRTHRRKPQQADDTTTVAATDTAAENSHEQAVRD